MICKCGRPIENVPEHLKHLAVWVCRECSNAPPSTGVVAIGPGGELEVDADSRPKTVPTVIHAA